LLNTFYTTSLGCWNTVLKSRNGNSTWQQCTSHTEKQLCVWQCPKTQNHRSDKPWGLKKGNSHGASHSPAI